MKSFLKKICLFFISIISFLNCCKSDEKKANTEDVAVNVGNDSTLIYGMKTLEDAKTLFEKHGLSKYWNVFKPEIKSSIKINPVVKTDKDIPIGKSKFCGGPDLPEGTAWFKDDSGEPLTFIAQINCAELDGLKKDYELPDSGLIYFFYSFYQPWGFDYKDKDKFKVFFYDGPNDKLVRRKIPDELEAKERNTVCELSFENIISLPPWDCNFVDNYLSGSELDTYFELTVIGKINKMFGYADNIQGCYMGEQCQLVTNGVYCGGGDSAGKDPRIEELVKGAGDWILLFQMDSEEDKTGMMWGDSGRIYFWIKKDDVKSRRFEKSWVILQCT